MLSLRSPVHSSPTQTELIPGPNSMEMFTPRSSECWLDLKTHVLKKTWIGTSNWEVKEKVRVTSVGTPTEFPGWPGRAGFQVPLFFSADLYDKMKQSILGSGSVKEKEQTTYGQSTPDMECGVLQLLSFY